MNYCVLHSWFRDTFVGIWEQVSRSEICVWHGIALWTRPNKKHTKLCFYTPSAFPLSTTRLQLQGTRARGFTPSTRQGQPIADGDLCPTILEILIAYPSQYMAGIAIVHATAPTYTANITGCFYSNIKETMSESDVVRGGGLGVGLDNPLNRCVRHQPVSVQETG